MVALLTIALTLGVIIPMKFAMQRDQEQEMIHRGVQYSRAIRGYYKKFGRYPTKIEDLENTNNLRYLRKRYKDPINKNKDFKLLHYGEQGVTLGAGGMSFGGGPINGATPAAGMNGSGPGGSAFGGSGPGANGSSFGSSGFGNGGLGNSGVNSSGVFSQSGLGGNSSSGNSNSAFGGSSNSQSNSGQTGTPGSDPTQASQEGTGTATGQGNSSSSGQQPVASGPVVGVASLSKETTIREFNKKKKYNEWQFIYDPSTEPRNGLITTPNQPLPGFGAQQPGLNANGQPGSPAGSTTTSPFGQSGGFGNNSSGFGNNNSGFGNNSSSTGPSTPAQPPASPPQ
jgi:hypothetical protein